MEKASGKISGLLALFLLFLITGPAYGWHDKTHLAIAQAASFENWYNCAAPDVTKTKIQELKSGDLESPNHWINNTNVKGDITKEMVLAQVGRYNDPNDKEGHLYGAIIGSLYKYIDESKKGKYGAYHLAFCAHYIGDLSNPFHNIEYGDNKFNNDKRHKRNDGIIEYSVSDSIGFIKRNMKDMEIKTKEDLAQKIADLANISRRLARKLEEEIDPKTGKKGRDMTKDEAYTQVTHSASLLHAVINFAKTQINKKNQL